MKSRPSSFAEAIQRALQLDFFKDFLFSDSPAVSKQKAEQNPGKKPKKQAKGVVGPAQNPVTKVPPPIVPGAGNQRKIVLQNQILEYNLRRSQRRSIGFLINQDGLRVTAPRWVTLADIERALSEKQGWILTKLGERQERQQQLSQRQSIAMRWQDGATFSYLGQTLTLRLSLHEPSSNPVHHIIYDREQQECRLRLVSFNDEPRQEEFVKQQLKNWLQQEAAQFFSERMQVYAEKLGVRYQSLSLSNATTRWGSCTSQGKIRLNWRLICFSPELIDYVIAHELSHLHEMNHSSRFWAKVQSVYPDFEQAKRRLRQHAANDLPAF
ncbi:SprT family zinc-dependent metalloprotease [soil metagenome]